MQEMSLPISGEELLRRYAAGERNLGGVFAKSGSFWEGEPPTNIKLRGIILSGADLSNVRLEGANLKSSTFRGTGLDEASLRGANLENTDLSGASLCKTKFGGANLSGAIFRGAFIEETEFSNADLSYADLKGAVGIEISYLDGATFCETIMPDGSIRNDNC
jgi:uncharacterized protein YjbI with pentapeptide repeats